MQKILNYKAYKGKMKYQGNLCVEEGDVLGNLGSIHNVNKFHRRYNINEQESLRW